MGQFQDRGDQYRPVIYYNSPAQKEAAEKSKQELAESGKFDDPIVTQIEPAQPFYPAEEYHQDFYKKKIRFVMQWKKRVAEKNLSKNTGINNESFVCAW